MFDIRSSEPSKLESISMHNIGQELDLTARSAKCREKGDKGPTGEKVGVTVRFRPLLPREQNDESWEGYSLDRHNVTAVHREVEKGRSTHFGPFNRVFDADADQQQLHDEIGMPIMRNVLDGYHGTILAYGATSAGKTHSMIGTGSDDGLAPRCVKDLFVELIDVSDTLKVVGSIVEIYNDIVLDLSADHRSHPCVPRRCRLDLCLKSLFSGWSTVRRCYRG